MIKFIKNYIVLTILFISVFMLIYYTPLHSDDYSYKMMGFDISNHLRHYFSWSGRFFSDYISVVLVSIESKIVLSFIQSIALMTIIFSFMYTRKFTDKKVEFFTSDYLIIFVVYFLSHPSFGQSNLWVVGSANYMWTSLVHIFFILSIINYYSRKTFKPVILLFAFLSGWSNENMAITLIGATGLLLIWDTYKNKKIDPLLLTIIITLTFGAALLILAPGNFNRLSNPAFNSWHQTGIFEKIYVHLFKRMPYSFQIQYLGYAISLIGIFLSYFSGKRKLTNEFKITPTAYALIFLALSIISNLSMILSPSFPDRALTPSFTFIMFSIIFSYYNNYEIISSKITKSALTILSILAFLFYYIPVINAFSSISIQEKIRSDIILNSNNGDVKLPEYYFTTLPRWSYRFDTYNNIDAMKDFYNIRTLNLFWSDFDYSVINKKPLNKDNKYIKIHVYSEGYETKSVFIFELMNQKNINEINNSRVFFNLTDINGKKHILDFQPSVREIDGRTFLFTKTEIPLYKIRDINFSLCSKSAPFKILAKEYYSF